MDIDDYDAPADVREQAKAWLARQCEISAAAMGDKWPEHREWIEDYVREEIRQRFVARGWHQKPNGIAQAEQAWPGMQIYRQAGA